MRPRLAMSRADARIQTAWRGVTVLCNATALCEVTVLRSVTVLCEATTLEQWLSP
ncbi:hypothetical protein GCM10011591_41240 [Nocardia camponoti]|uniref:Uncharacterized protein n=1 Tax=Nocardia camponoti TaxID=1616106 RepID=A0A917QRD4_9NOCA|nr:hypothetical protein GCM10011591_41240 [Nocardia camponoti]